MILSQKIKNIEKDFFDSNAAVEDIPQYPNVDNFNFDRLKASLLDRLELFVAPPFTIQRMCELLVEPKKQYSRIDKFMRALEKNILVVSTVTDGGRRNSENDSNLFDLSLNGSAEISEESKESSGEDQEQSNMESNEEENEKKDPQESSKESSFHRLDDDDDDSESPSPKKMKLDNETEEVEQEKQTENDQKDHPEPRIDNSENNEIEQVQEGNNEDKASDASEDQVMKEVVEKVIVVL